MLQKRKEVETKKIIYYPNQLDEPCILNFESNKIVSSPPSKSNHGIDGEHTKFSKSSLPN